MVDYLLVLDCFISEPHSEVAIKGDTFLGVSTSGLTAHCLNTSVYDGEGKLFFTFTSAFMGKQSLLS